MWRVCASDGCYQGPWACIINNEGALKEKADENDERLQVYRASRRKSQVDVFSMCVATVNEKSEGQGVSSTRIVNNEPNLHKNLADRTLAAGTCSFLPISQ